MKVPSKLRVTRWTALKIMASAAHSNRVTLSFAFPLWLFPQAWPVLLRGWNRVRKVEVQIVLEQPVLKTAPNSHPSDGGPKEIVWEESR